MIRAFACVILLLPMFSSVAGAQSGGFAPRWPDTPMPRATTGSTAPAAEPQAAPPPPAPPAPRTTQAAPEVEDAAPEQPRPAARRVDAIRCEGPFGRDSSEKRLIAAFGEKNVVFSEVSGPEGSKLNATVVFPADPKRRLEVLWQDEETRTKPYSIVIEGASTWLAPRGVRLGTPLAEVERLNGKSFKLSGFEGDYGGQVSDWQGGAMTKLPGGCAIGIRFSPDQKAPAEAREKVAGEKNLTSNEAGVRAVRPKVSEIFVGYTQ